jgi:epimerase transport system membrane fusion protein
VTKENLAEPSADKTEQLRVLDTSMESPKRVGSFIFFLVFGVFGFWAGFAPLDGAARASGVVTVESYKKVIQHLEGGIVAEILVRNGDVVAAGDPLLVLDNTQSLAQLEIANAQFVALKSREARLLAESSGSESISFAAVLMQAGSNADAEMASERQIFLARKAARDGEVEVLEQREDQLASRVTGLEAVRISKLELAASYSEELVDVRELLKEGFSDKQRLRELERSYSSYNGEAADLTANISTTQMQIGETRLQILQQDKDFLNEVVNELGEVRSQLKDSEERAVALRDIVRRTSITAPAGGIVNGMQIHTIGGVVRPGVDIAEIVPQLDELIIEANVAPMDIDRVTVGQEATISFSAFSSGLVPTIYGKVIGISADRLTDQSTGVPYYLARVEVTPEGMSDMGNLVLVSGMPAEVFITTGTRTFLQYITKPFTIALSRSFIED